MSSKEERIAEHRQRVLWKAGMVLRQYLVKEMSYEEAVLCLKDTYRIFSDLPATDQAFEYFNNQLHCWQNICNSLAVIEDKNARDHLEPLEVIWSYDSGKVLEQATLWVNLGSSKKFQSTWFNNHFLSLARAELLSLGIEPHLLGDLELELM